MSTGARTVAQQTALCCVDSRTAGGVGTPECPWWRSCCQAGSLTWLPALPLPHLVCLLLLRLLLLLSQLLALGLGSSLLLGLGGGLGLGRGRGLGGLLLLHLGGHVVLQKCRCQAQPAVSTSCIKVPYQYTLYKGTLNIVNRACPARMHGGASRQVPVASEVLFVPQQRPSRATQPHHCGQHPP